MHLHRFTYQEIFILAMLGKKGTSYQGENILEQKKRKEGGEKTDRDYIFIGRK